ncbi:MAG TPA: hypothetical protein VF477_05800 [Mycobacterium sp.]
MDSTKLKLMCATAGAGAVVAMGALSVAFSETSSAEPAEPAPPGPVTTSAISTGETTEAGETATETKPPPVPTTTIAEPSITGPAPLPPEEEDAK